ncbi:MAG: ABC transporter ATP-binding protein [Paludibacteraceae bacterium]
MNTVISIENVSKSYQLGTINTGTFYGDLKRWWAKQHGRPDPYQKIGETDHGNRQGETLWALKDINFQVQQGEALGIIGRNGAGKSTLLKILSRVTVPTSGEVKVKGRIASLLEVGTGFHPELTGRENIYLNGAIMGMNRREIQRKFDEIVDFSGVEKFIDTPVKRYSSGMYVRLAFAVAAHLEPEILIVDEVLAVGDAEFQKKCLGKMDDVAHQGRTVLFVSHNMGAIMNLCSFTILLNKGFVETSGQTNDVINHYLNEGVKPSGEEIITAMTPGTHTNEILFSAIRIFDINNHPNNQLPLGNDVILEMEFEIKDPIKGANIAFHLWNNAGVCVLSSTDIDFSYLNIIQTRLPGKYAARCSIPQEYFRPGRYSLGISASIPGFKVLADLPDVIYFDIVDTGSVVSKIGQGRQGIIAPVLEWLLVEKEAPINGSL